MPDNRTPFQIQQDEEAEGRNAAIIDRAGNKLGADPHQTPIDDNLGETDPPGRQPRAREVEPEPREEDEVVDRRSPGDIKRAEIAARFKRNKDGEGAVPFNGNPNDPEMLYGRAGRAQDTDLEPGDDDPSIVGSRQQEPREDEPPKKRKLIILGQEVWLTDAEILERASKVSAADTYLEEGRQLLKDAREIKNSAKRTGQEPQNPEDRTGTQDDQLNLDATEHDQHPDELEAAIEEIQFGDPKNAAEKIRKVIAAASDQSADRRQLDRLINNDVVASKKQLQAFMDQNPDLAKDGTANVIMESYMYDIYREDITKLGIDPALIPTNTDELANWHRFYRVRGDDVRSTSQALTTAKTRFDTWRGVAPKPTDRQRAAAPRIQVSVDRDRRREAIPNSPSRAASPRPDANVQAPQRKSRHQIIMDMKRARGFPVPRD